MPGAASRTRGWQVTVIETSASVSRSVRNATLVPGRRLTWVSWPSTQIRPSRSIHSDSVPRDGAQRERLLGRGLDGHPWSVGAYGCERVTDTGKRVLLAAPRGYCAGVDRAVVTVEKALDLYGAPVYVRKEIVHNKYVVSELESRGAIFVEETEEVPEGATVVFSAHGVAPVVHDEAAARNLRTIDATCPLVTKVHQEARKFAAEDYEILLIGHEGHEEVIGTAGEAPDRVTLVDGPDHVDAPRHRPEREGRLALADHAVGRRDLRDGRPPACALPAARRPAERRHLLRDAEPPVGREADRAAVRPGHRRRLGQLVELGAAGRGRARRRRERVLPRRRRVARSTRRGSTVCTTVGVTSGASVPEILVVGVLELLREHGFDDVQEISAADEGLLFALPQELRRDLKAAGKS